MTTRTTVHTGMMILLLTAGVLSTHGQAPDREWSQWRGPSRDGVVAAADTPKAWPESWTPAWTAEVGEGYASPVTSGGVVYVHSRIDPEEMVTAFDATTGAVRWKRQYPAAFRKNSYANDMAKGPNATPLVSAGRLFTFGASGILIAWKADTGDELWRKDFSALVDTTKLFCGTAASPVLAHGLVVVQVGSDVHGGQISGLDPATGEAKWTWKGPGPGYASPLVVTINDVSQLITLTNSTVVGLDARTGSHLWSIPFPDEWHENIVTPVWTGTHLIVSGTRQGTHAYQVTRTGSVWQTQQAWRNTDAAMYMSSPVLANNLLIGLSARRKGQFVALNVSTGAMAWSSEGRDADHASVLMTAAHIVYLTAGGDLILVKRDATQYAVDRTYEVSSRATYAVPLFLSGDLIVRDATHVTRLRSR